MRDIVTLGSLLKIPNWKNNLSRQSLQTSHTLIIHNINHLPTTNYYVFVLGAPFSTTYYIYLLLTYSFQFRFKYDGINTIDDDTFNLARLLCKICKYIFEEKNDKCRVFNFYINCCGGGFCVWLGNFGGKHRCATGTGICIILNYFEFSAVSSVLVIGFQIIRSNKKCGICRAKFEFRLPTITSK